jgi:hypothetical protein
MSAIMKYWNGSAWVATDSGAINNGAGTRIEVSNITTLQTDVTAIQTNFEELNMMMSMGAMI